MAALQRSPMSSRVKEWKDNDIHPQQASPLFRLPSELRQMVFELALTKTVVPHPLALAHDFDVQRGHPLLPDTPLRPRCIRRTGPGPVTDLQCYETGWDWLRPDNTGPAFISCALLRACRRAYLETAHLPALEHELIIYSDAGSRRSPPWDTSYARRNHLAWDASCPARSQLARQARDWGDGIPYHALRRLRRLRWYSELHRLVADVPHLSKQSLAWMADHQRPPAAPLPPLRVFDLVQSLHLTFRHLDFHHNIAIGAPAVHPFVGFPNALVRAHMHQAIAPGINAAGPPAPRDPRPYPSPMMAEPYHPHPTSLATGLALMPALRDLTIDFEFSAELFGAQLEMESMVRWATTHWRFLVFRNTPLLARDTDIWDVPPDAATRDGRPVRRAWLVPRAHVEKWSWRGRPYHFAFYCPVCAGASTKGCLRCAERADRRADAEGPRLLVWTARWTAVEDVEYNRLADKVQAQRASGSHPVPEPEPVPEIPSWAHSDEEEIKRRRALSIML